MWAGTFDSQARTQSRLRGLTSQRCFILTGWLPSSLRQWQGLSQHLGLTQALGSCRLSAGRRASSGFLCTEDLALSSSSPWALKPGAHGQ